MAWLLLSAAKAARAAEKEAQALRAARISYQQALLDQQAERTAMLKSINDTLKVCQCTAVCYARVHLSYIHQLQAD